MSKPFFKVGQIYKDLDKRCPQREIKIVGFVFFDEKDLIPSWALCASRRNGGPWCDRLTRIKLDRFVERGNGYELCYSPAQGKVVTL